MPTNDSSRSDLNLAELGRLEREMADWPALPESCKTMEHGACEHIEKLVQLRPLLGLVEKMGEVLAYRGCARRGPGGHYNSVRCLDQGTQGHGSDEYGDKPLAKEKWCDGCTALEDYRRAKGEA